MKKRPLRYIWTILIFLLLGAILNVAVAWGCVMWIKYPDHNDDNLSARNSNWIATVPDSWPQQAQWIVGTNALGITKYWYSADTESIKQLAGCIPSPLPGPYPGVSQLTVWQAGWPMRSLYREWHMILPNFDPHHAWRMRGRPPDPRYKPQSLNEGIPISRRLTRSIRNIHTDDWYWPVLPLWPGIIFNTLFYAVILWLLIVGPFILRRHGRIRRGRCGQCGYLVAPNIGIPGASPNCPECGTPIPPAPGIGKPDIIKSKSGPTSSIKGI